MTSNKIIFTANINIVNIMSDLISNKIIVKIDNTWFDLSKYAPDHPGGGIRFLKKYHLTDVTIFFREQKGHWDAFVDRKLEETEVKDKNLLEILDNLTS